MLRLWFVYLAFELNTDKNTDNGPVNWSKIDTRLERDVMIEHHKLRISARIAKMEEDQMRNLEIAYAKNRRAQKKYERELNGPFG